MEELILKENPDTIGAMFAEPVMGAGGVIIPPVTYFEKIQAVLTKYDILLVADEVICGFARTGSMWGSDTYSLKPDMVTCAKALSASYAPISATMISDKLYQAMADASDRLGVFAHGFTYGGHPVSCAVALETLKIYEERDIVSHVQSVAPTFDKFLNTFAHFPLTGEIRNVGLVGAIQLVKDPASKEFFEPSEKAGATFQALAQKHGVILRAMGETLAFCPPLIITEEEIAELQKRIEATFDEFHSWAKDHGFA